LFLVWCFVLGVVFGPPPPTKPPTPLKIKYRSAEGQKRLLRKPQLFWTQLGKPRVTLWRGAVSREVKMRQQCPRIDRIAIALVAVIGREPQAVAREIRQRLVDGECVEE
jgi:hypothetical protein